MWTAMILACQMGQPTGPSNCIVVTNQKLFETEAECQRLIYTYLISAADTLQQQGIFVAGLECKAWESDSDWS